MKRIKKTVHIIDPYFLGPTNPLTVNLIGAGGTGSSMLTALARVNHALNALGHAGLHVRAIDPDTISEANGGRLLFTTAEVGLPKSVALINRTNRFFGTNWKAYPERFGRDIPYANLTVSCVDNVDTRFLIAKELQRWNVQRFVDRDAPRYWMDCGNTREGGQVLLSTVGRIEQPKSRKFRTVEKLPFITEEYGDMLRTSEAADDTPSCSLAEALEKQDLFINTVLADMAASLLWQLFRKGMLENRGFFMNLADFRAQPIKIVYMSKRKYERKAA